MKEFFVLVFLIFIVCYNLDFSSPLTPPMKEVCSGYPFEDKNRNDIVEDIRLLLEISEEIPSASGFYGRYIQAFINKTKHFFGSLFAQEKFELEMNFTSFKMSKFYGIKEDSFIPILNGLRDTQSEIRYETRLVLSNWICFN